MPTQTPTSRIFRLAPSVASTFHATLSVGHNAEVPADCIADCQSALNRHVQTPLQQWVDLGCMGYMCTCRPAEAAASFPPATAA